MNPWLFEATVNKELFVNGLPVDQRDFDEQRRLTKYGGGFAEREGRMWDI